MSGAPYNFAGGARCARDDSDAPPIPFPNSLACGAQCAQFTNCSCATFDTPQQLCTLSSSGVFENDSTSAPAQVEAWLKPSGPAPTPFSFDDDDAPLYGPHGRDVMKGFGAGLGVFVVLFFCFFQSTKRKGHKTRGNSRKLSHSSHRSVRHAMRKHSSGGSGPKRHEVEMKNPVSAALTSSADSSPPTDPAGSLGDRV